MTVSTLTVVPEASASGTAPYAEPATESAFAIARGRLRRPRLLDLCCGGGGASAGYHAAGFDVVGVDVAPQPDYPFSFVQADAFTVDLAGFDVVAASPPCQRWSAATPPDRRREYPDLIGPLRDRLSGAVAAGVVRAYVIENVPGSPLHDPVTVCGDSLRLGVRRHRLFESNLPLVGTPCWHDRPAPPIAVYGTYSQRPNRRRDEPESSRATDQARAAMGIAWLPWPALTQAIPPAYTYWLGVQLLTLLGPLDHPELDGPGPVGGYVTDAAVYPSPDCVTLVDGEPSRRDLRAGGVPSRIAGALRHCRCGRPLPPRPAIGRWPRYCSHACRQAAYRQRQRGTNRSGGGR